MQGLRARKKAWTRQAIEAAAFALFADRGYDRTTVEDIAARAEVAPRTVFRYFRSKDELVIGVFDREFARWAQAFDERHAGDTLGMALRRATLTVNDAYLADPAAFDRRRTLFASEPALARRLAAWQTEVGERAAAAIARRMGVDLQADLRPRLIAAAAMGAVGAAAGAWEAAGRPEGRERYIAQAYDLLEQMGALFAAPLPDPA